MTSKARADVKDAEVENLAQEHAEERGEFCCVSARISNEEEQNQICRTGLPFRCHQTTIFHPQIKVGGAEVIHIIFFKPFPLGPFFGCRSDGDTWGR